MNLSQDNQEFDYNYLAISVESVEENEMDIAFSTSTLTITNSTNEAQKDPIWKVLRQRTNRVSNGWRTYFKYLIQAFSIFFLQKFLTIRWHRHNPMMSNDAYEYYSKFNMHIQGLTRWKHYTSTKNTSENKKQANPSSYKDGWPSNHVMSCEILLQCLCKLHISCMSSHPKCITFDSEFIVQAMFQDLSLFIS